MSLLIEQMLWFHGRTINSIRIKNEKNRDAGCRVPISSSFIANDDVLRDILVTTTKMTIQYTFSALGIQSWPQAARVQPAQQSIPWCTMKRLIMNVNVENKHKNKNLLSTRFHLTVNHLKLKLQLILWNQFVWLQLKENVICVLVGWWPIWYVHFGWCQTRYSVSYSICVATHSMISQFPLVCDLPFPAGIGCDPLDCMCRIDHMLCDIYIARYT